MMDYATDVRGAAAQPMPELGRLKAASEFVAVASNRIEQFLTRFTGPIPPPPASGQPDVAAQGYRDDLNCLFAQIERLQGAVPMLDHIG